MIRSKIKKLSFSPRKKDGANERSSLDQVDSGFNSMEFSNITDSSNPSIAECLSFQSTTQNKLNKTPLKSRDENILGTPSKKQTSDYGSMHELENLSMVKERTPTKRRKPTNDENAENYVSPPKIKARENRARRTLREKCISENAIPHCSTPIKNEERKKLRKFRSFHPEKFRRSIESSSIIKDTITEEESPQSGDQGTPKLDKLDESSINISTLDISHWDSTNFSLNCGPSQYDTPPGISALCSAPLKTVVEHKNESILEKQRRLKFYDGEEFVDILQQLNKTQIIPPIDLILRYLDDSDLSNLYRTSRTIYSIVQGNKHAKKRLIAYLNQEQMTKENRDVSKQVKDKEAAILVPEKREPLVPLCHQNFNSFYQPSQQRYFLRSPPVSPKRRGFYNNQKVIGDRRDIIIKKCPRCKSSAPIVTMKLTPKKSRRGNSVRKGEHSMILRKSTFQYSIMNSSSILDKTALTFSESVNSSDSGSSSRSNSSSPVADDYSYMEKANESDDEYEYAHCSKKSCDFKFCFKCSCRYHPRKNCKELSPPSPSRPVNTSVAGTKESKKSLKRLFK